MEEGNKLGYWLICDLKAEGLCVCVGGEEVEGEERAAGGGGESEQSMVIRLHENVPLKPITLSTNRNFRNRTIMSVRVMETHLLWWRDV